MGVVCLRLHVYATLVFAVFALGLNGVAMGAPLVQPEVLGSSNGTLDATLTVAVGRVETGEFSFNARLYNGAMPAPTLEFSAGDTVRLLLENDLEPNADEGTPNSFRQPNTTNVHTHGLHVSSQGNQDNVLIQAAPGESLQYEYTIHPQHGGGTFWYHPHFHGSTTIQGGGGMAGVIVVRDEPGSLEPALDAMTEQVMLFQYVNVGGGEPGPTLFGDHDRVARMARSELYMDVDGSGEVYLVNGQNNPTVTMQPGEWQRWRLVHASSSVSLHLVLSEGCEMQLIANDGVYLIDRTPIAIDSLSLVPGSRRDILVRCSAAGSYSISSSTDAPVPHHLFSKELPLVSIEVEGTPVTMDDVTMLPPLPVYLEDLREASVDEDFVIDFQEAYPEWPVAVPIGLTTLFLVMFGGYSTLWYRDSLDTLPLSPRGWKKMEMEDEPARGSFCRCMLLILVLVFLGVSIGVLAKTGRIVFGLNGKPFEGGDAFIHSMSLGSVQEWVIDSDHPWHMHINHFQLISASCSGRCLFGFIPGEFYDTVMLGVPEDEEEAEEDGDYTMRFKPVDYTGTVMLHCHILGHEDLGMMAVAEIVE